MSHWKGWRPSKKPWDPFKPWEFSMMHPADSVPKELLEVMWGGPDDFGEEEWQNLLKRCDEIIEKAQREASQKSQ